MEYIIIIIVSILVLGVLAYIFELNVKKLKEIGGNKELDELTNAFPENMEICKYENANVATRNCSQITNASLNSPTHPLTNSQLSTRSTCSTRLNTFRVFCVFCSVFCF